MGTINGFLFVLINVAMCGFEKSEDDKNNFVFSGKCVKQSTNYCNELVENSVCNNLKDECFCRKGYVAIREGTRISCKTLLTDLVCRMDRDCVHVADSMCHPGAGQCVCPGQHIYVESINACRRKSEDVNNNLCQACRHSNGQCFEYTRQDLKAGTNKLKNNLGCGCSSHRSTIDLSDGLCTTQLVDIGEFCNNKDLLCRSKKSTCSRLSNKDTLSTCTCVTGHVPVYQKTLQYYECFAILGESTFPNCSKCFKAGGYCYDVNGDQDGDGCSCQSRFSNEVDGLSSLLKPCSINHVSVNCHNERMSICYRAHTRAPYRSLDHQLINGRARALIKLSKISNKVSSARQRLIISTETYNDKYLLNELRMTPNENRFCTEISWADDRFIEAYQLKNDQVRYSTQIHIMVNSLKSTPGRDLKFEVSCVSTPPKEGASLVKRINSNENRLPEEHSLSLDLRLINSVTNSETNSATYGDLVKLDVSLVDSNGIYRDIEVLKCWTTNQTNIYLKPVVNKTTKPIYSRCHEQNTVYNYNSLIWFQSPPGIHYHSSDFTPDLFNNLSTTEYHCLILLCRHKTICTNQDFCDLIEKYSINQKENNQFIIIERKSYLSLRTAIDSVATVQDAPTKECRYSLCLTQPQAIVTSVLMLSLLLLVVILVAILYRRQRAIQDVTLKHKGHIRNLEQQQINTLCNHHCGRKLFLLSDTASLSTSMDKSESEPCSMYSPMYVANDTYKSTMTCYQDNIPKSFGRPTLSTAMHSTNTQLNNKAQNLILIKNIPNNINIDIDETQTANTQATIRISMETSDKFNDERNAVLTESTVNNEVRKPLCNSAYPDAYV